MMVHSRAAAPHPPNETPVHIVARGFAAEDALFDFVRDCAAEADRARKRPSAWRVTIEARSSVRSAGVTYEVTIHDRAGAVGEVWTHEDGHAYKAVRDAFALITAGRPGLDASGCPWRAGARV
jgi:hypothetical protein